MPRCFFWVSFKGQPPSRGIDEGFRGELLRKLNEETNSKLGNTLMGENRGFLKFLNLTNSENDHHYSVGSLLMDFYYFISIVLLIHQKSNQDLGGPFYRFSKIG